MRYSDSQSLLEAVKSSKYISKKRLGINIAALKKYINNKDINDIKWTESWKQLANIVTPCSANPLSLIKVLSNGYL